MEESELRNEHTLKDGWWLKDERLFKDELRDEHPQLKDGLCLRDEHPQLKDGRSLKNEHVRKDGPWIKDDRGPLGPERGTLRIECNPFKVGQSPKDELGLRDEPTFSRTICCATCVVATLRRCFYAIRRHRPGFSRAALLRRLACGTDHGFRRQSGASNGIGRGAARVVGSKLCAV